MFKRGFDARRELGEHVYQSDFFFGKLRRIRNFKPRRAGLCENAAAARISILNIRTGVALK